MRKILSVDDDPMILQCLSDALKTKGYHVFVTSNPEEVAKIASENEIDLVMLDVCMPIKNGLEIFRELKKKYTNLPILFVTAYPKSFSLRSGEMLKMWQNEFADGQTDIMYKPFNIELLYEKIEGLIGAAEEES